MVGSDYLNWVSIVLDLAPVSFPVSGAISEGTFSIMLGVSLEQNWQNIPANILGFVSALYTFRALCPKIALADETNE